jgi:hypothetical protein
MAATTAKILHVTSPPGRRVEEIPEPIRGGTSAAGSGRYLYPRHAARRRPVGPDNILVSRPASSTACRSPAPTATRGGEAR